MFVNAHARARLRERLPEREADAIERRLEAEPGVPGLVAYIVARLDSVRAAGRSVGDTVVAMVEDGEVVTVCYRDGMRQRHPIRAEKVVRWA